MLEVENFKYLEAPVEMNSEVKSEWSYLWGFKLLSGMKKKLWEEVG